MKNKLAQNLEKNNKKRRVIKLTNYTKRLKLLKSKLSRLVIRKTNKYIIVQLVDYCTLGDKILWTKTTKELVNTNLVSSGKSLETSFYFGKNILGFDRDFVVDIGMRRPKKDSPFFVWSFLKGLSQNLNLNESLLIKIKDKIKNIK